MKKKLNPPNRNSVYGLYLILHKSSQLTNRFLVSLVIRKFANPFGCNQPGPLQHRKILGSRRLRHVQLVRNLAYTYPNFSHINPFMGCKMEVRFFEPLQDLITGFIRQSLKYFDRVHNHHYIDNSRYIKLKIKDPLQTEYSGEDGMKPARLVKAKSSPGDRLLFDVPY